MRVWLTSPWIPAEWVRAHGLEPRGLWFEDQFCSQVAPGSAGVCAFAEHAVQVAETQPDAAVIFTTTCDQLRRGFDAATFQGRSRGFLFNVPATPSPAAKQIYRAEVERLGRFLLELGGVAPTPEVLRREMLQADETRRGLREAAQAAPACSVAEAVAGCGHRRAFSAPGVAPSEPLVPLAVIGGPLRAAEGNLFEAIEAAGGRIALDATESGERNLCPVFGNADDPFDALVAGYFENIVDVFQRPNTRLYAWLKAGLSDRRARGIVLWHFTGCDLWRAEEQTLRETFGLPVLPLDAAEGARLSPREVTRIEAFIEALK
jgi:benzoyl-CoA reductase/2-hydroxyglutaryl-CoA dehydratase subunit BcrC/BadD/HgdB